MDAVPRLDWNVGVTHCLKLPGKINSSSFCDIRHVAVGKRNRKLKWKKCQRCDWVWWRVLWTGKSPYVRGRKRIEMSNRMELEWRKLSEDMTSLVSFIVNDWTAYLQTRAGIFLPVLGRFASCTLNMSQTFFYALWLRVCVNYGNYGSFLWTLSWQFGNSQSLEAFSNPVLGWFAELHASLWNYSRYCFISNTDLLCI